MNNIMKDKIKNNNYKVFNIDSKKKFLNKFSHEFYVFNNDFPRLRNYSNIEEIKSTFLHLKKINNNVKIDKEIINNNMYFLIKVENLEDIHKSIKYGVWNDPDIYVNKKISSSYKFLRNSIVKRKIYLVFASSGLKEILGIAKVNSEFNFNKNFNYWKFKRNIQNNGCFELKWKLIFNIPFNEIDNFNEFYSIEELDNGSNIKSEITTEILKKYNSLIENKSQESIFNMFYELDLNEDKNRSSRKNVNTFYIQKNLTNDNKTKYNKDYDQRINNNNRNSYNDNRFNENNYYKHNRYSNNRNNNYY